MLQLIHRNSEIAMIVLHEIYGINAFIKQVCENLFDKGYDVFCPNLLDREDFFSYEQQKEAYESFQEKDYLERMTIVEQILKETKRDYAKVFIVGYSVGATLAWALSEGSYADGIICYYGSRIRDFLHINPRCPTLIIFGEKEQSFSPREIIGKLEKKSILKVHQVAGSHGFLDPCSKTFDEDSTRYVKQLTEAFILSTSMKKEDVQEGPE